MTQPLKITKKSSIQPDIGDIVCRTYKDEVKIYYHVIGMLENSILPIYNMVDIQTGYKDWSTCEDTRIVSWSMVQKGKIENEVYELFYCP